MIELGHDLPEQLGAGLVPDPLQVADERRRLVGPQMAGLWAQGPPPAGGRRPGVGIDRREGHQRPLCLAEGGAELLVGVDVEPASEWLLARQQGLDAPSYGG